MHYISYKITKLSTKSTTRGCLYGKPREAILTVPARSRKKPVSDHKIGKGVLTHLNFNKFL